MLVLWGALTFAGYVVSFGLPQRAGYAWVAVYHCGHRRFGLVRRREQEACGGEYVRRASHGGHCGVHCLWRRLEPRLGHFTPRQLGAFWPSYFMLPYIIAGLWLGSAFVVIGATIIALTLIGYFFAGPWFELWMALVNGGGLHARRLLDATELTWRSSTKSSTSRCGCGSWRR